VPLARLGPGEVFGEMSLLTGARRSATVTATVETRVLEISKQSIAHLLEAEGGLMDTLGVALANRLAERSRLVRQEPPSSVEPDLLKRIRDFFEI
jgi:CRP-like cAMP-binding protein